VQCADLKLFDYQKTRYMTMSLDDEGNQPNRVGNEEERQSTKRSERKRQREKQRRSDLSNAFDELAAFIVQVEPESGDQDLDSKKKRKKSDGGEDASGITRLDLIGRALRIMRRLHTENEERKRIITGIQEKGGVPTNDNVSKSRLNHDKSEITSDPHFSRFFVLTFRYW
jgi:hypothetical protein